MAPGDGGLPPSAAAAATTTSLTPSSPSIFLRTVRSSSPPPISLRCRLPQSLALRFRPPSFVRLRTIPVVYSKSPDSPDFLSASESVEMTLEEEVRPMIECIGTGSDVECVIRPSEDRFNGVQGQSSKSSKQTSFNTDSMPVPESECVGTGTDVQRVIASTNDMVATNGKTISNAMEISTESSSESALLLNGTEQQIASSVPLWLRDAWENLILISPFFFWGTAMVAMKGILPKAGPLFVAATRLIPSGILLVSFAIFQNRKQPSGFNAWFAITLFALVDGTCFQGFLAEGLKRTSAGLGSVIIDSQPLTVAILASIFFGETIGALGVLGLATGVFGLLLLEVPPQVIGEFLKGHIEELKIAVSTENGWSVWDSGEWWMLLAAQSMAVGTVMVRWICKFSDPVMATGWHMVIGGLPLLALASFQHDPALSGHIQDLQPSDWLALAYTSVFGSAVSYGVFFYNASRGSLTKLSSLTFLTPMFAALFGFLLLDETLTPVQIAGAIVTLGAIFLINKRVVSNNEDDAKM